MFSKYERWTEQFESDTRYGPASPPGAPPKLQGASIMAWLPLGAAWRIGSTPLNNLMTVLPPEGVPSVLRTAMASPLCRSASATGGVWSSNRWKSNPPPGRAPPGFPPPPVAPEPCDQPPDAAPGGAFAPAGGAEFADELAAAPGVPGGIDPFNRVANRCAISAGI